MEAWVLYALASAFVLAMTTMFYIYKTHVSKVHTAYARAINRMVAENALELSKRAQEHQHHVSELRAEYVRGIAGVSRKMRDAEQSYEDELARLRQDHSVDVSHMAEEFNKRTQVQGTMVRGAVAAMFRTASLRENSEDGQFAARWLYVVMSMGHFRITTKEEARIIARGMYLAKASPVELIKLYDDLAAMTPDRFDPLTCPLCKQKQLFLNSAGDAFECVTCGEVFVMQKNASNMVEQVDGQLELEYDKSPEELQSQADAEDVEPEYDPTPEEHAEAVAMVRPPVE